MEFGIAKIGVFMEMALPECFGKEPRRPRNAFEMYIMRGSFVNSCS